MIDAEKNADQIGKNNKKGVARDQAESKKLGKKAEVSEYTKWMDGAESAMADDGKSAKASDDEAEDDEGANDSGYDDDDGNGDSDDDDTSGDEDSMSADEKRANALRRKYNKLKRTMDTLYRDEHLAFNDLIDSELTIHSGEWDWTIKFFSKAKQGHTSLGRFNMWTDLNEIVFDRGESCWQGPRRSMTVKFVCGLEKAILDVSEPSRCLYHSTVSHPGACNPDDIVDMTVREARHPLDEL